MSGTRLEADSLGEIAVAADALWGAHTERARQNFPISGRTVGAEPDLVIALARIKQAAARANLELGVLDPDAAAAIDAACERIAAGEAHDAFVVDLVQGGAGTSTNMNANEVIANLALRALGRRPGDYGALHPVDQVNRSQSTNDVYPTAVRLALCAATERLLVELDLLTAAFAQKGREFASVLKMGRTQLQDAVPMTLGQEFTAFASALRRDARALAAVLPELAEINLGGTAIGTGITAPAGYAERVRVQLCALIGRELRTADDLVEATSGTGAFVQLSGQLKRLAVTLTKSCNDLRLLSSGPQAGLGEIRLPARQAGSSIMPGKVNPVIPEMMNQVAFAVIGADATVTAAASAGQLQLNAFEPVIAETLLRMLSWLRAASATLRVRCIEGIAANAEHTTEVVQHNVGAVTALTGAIGYDAAARIAKRSLHTGVAVLDLVVDAGLLTAEEATAAMSPRMLANA